MRGVLMQRKSLEGIAEDMAATIRSFEQQRYLSSVEKVGLALVKELADELQKHVSNESSSEAGSEGSSDDLVNSSSGEESGEGSEVRPEDYIVDRLKKIFKNKWLSEPEQMWAFYISNSSIKRSIMSLAQYLADKSSLDYYDMIMPDPLLFATTDRQHTRCDELANPENLNQFIMMINDTGAVYLENIEDAKRRFLESKKIECPDSTPMRNQESVVVKLADTRITQIHRGTIEYDPFKVGLSQTTINKLLMLAKSGSSAEADRPDDITSVDESHDKAILSFIRLITRLEKNNMAEFKVLMNCKFGGMYLDRWIKSLGEKNCAGSFKRDLAQFLYENVDISDQDRKTLAFNYSKTTIKPSKMWAIHEKHLIPVRIDSKIEETKKTIEHNEQEVKTGKIKHKSFLEDTMSRKKTQTAESAHTPRKKVEDRKIDEQQLAYQALKNELKKILTFKFNPMIGVKVEAKIDDKLIINTVTKDIQILFDRIKGLVSAEFDNKIDYKNELVKCQIIKDKLKEKIVASSFKSKRLKGFISEPIMPPKNKDKQHVNDREFKTRAKIG